MINENVNRFILGVRIDSLTLSAAVTRILALSSEGSHYVCVANVHMVMESQDDFELKQIVNSASMVTPDGRPLKWGLNLLGLPEAVQVTGSDLTAALLSSAEGAGVPVGFFGSREAVLTRLSENLKRRFPKLNIVYAFSPPFRELSLEEDAKITEKIVSSGARILFVGLGCPKQEKWMAQHTKEIPAALIGIGAAFDFHAGTVARAPSWVQKIGFEWFFRLMLEPRRLWKRYLIHNPRFIFRFIRQLTLSSNFEL